MNCQRKSRALTGSIFEPLESRQMMAFFPAVNINPNLVIRGSAHQINGTSGSDFIRVSSINNPLTGRRLTVEINPSATNPATIVVLDPSQDVQINGLGGNDTIIYSGSDKVRIFGGEGNDKIIGGSGPDALFGGAGADTLDGGRGADMLSGGTEADTLTYASRTANLFVSTGNTPDDGEAGEGDNVQIDVETLIGGSGNDNLTLTAPGTPTQNPLAQLNFFVTVTTNKLVGNGGNDILTGSSGADILEGGAGDDVLRGAQGKDVLRGGTEDDRLYGGSGRDNLDGQAGNDGLFGGADASADNLTGGAGHDRFLFLAPDVIKDLAATDARITFENGKEETVKFGGQDGTYVYAAGSWNDSDVELLDSAFQALHKATGNTRLLKKFNKQELKFVRQGQRISAEGGDFFASAWNGGGQIHVVTPSEGTVFHEVGHNFDDEFDFTGWRLFSGWTQADMSNNSAYVDAAGNDGWFHLVNAPFVSSYARTNPFEDFSETFELNMRRRAGLPGNGTVQIFKNAFIDTMVNELAAKP